MYKSYMEYVVLCTKVDYVIRKEIDHSPYIVDFRSARRLPYDHRSVANTDTRFEPNKQGRGCMAPSLDGARAGPLANTLFGAKHGGHCHRQSASTFPSFRRQILRNS